ncbi:MAG: heparan-alpha-glucosaminide N-acetyltransferase domain-containing protein [Terracidiphilus sp.]
MKTAAQVTIPENQVQEIRSSKLRLIEEAPIQNPSLQNASPNPRRVASIDMVRGLVMVLMALDHTRDFISNIPFEPENIDQTWGFYFLVRWVTHLCAPAFFLLAGVGAYLYGKRHSPRDLQRFLVSRGIWLALLEFTIIGFAWTFHPGWGMFGVICCLGISMILLAAFVRLPRVVVMAVALIVIATHDLFDGLKPAAFHAGQWLLFVLHRSGRAHVGDISVFVLFPLIPWCAVTLLGFSMGALFESNSASSRRTLLWAGAGSLALFTILRFTNIYGNPGAAIAHSTPGDWHPMPTWSKTVILFFDVEKYPPSLEFLLMTLGVIFVLLAMGGLGAWGWFGRVLETYGRVPLFYYILHLYVIHLAAILLGFLTHQPVRWLFHGGFFLNYPPDGAPPYGHGLAVVCAMWICVVALLYFPCKWFARVKRDHPDTLLRFF